MFERFTEKAIRVMTAAQISAKELNHSKLFPEHLLLGIVNQKSGIASKFLKAAGLNSQNMTQEIKSLLISYETQSAQDILPFSDNLKIILKRTWDKSVELKTNYIAPEHIFLSLISEDDTNVMQILKSYDVDTLRIKDSVERIIERKDAAKTHPEFLPKNQAKEQKSLSKIVFEEENLKPCMHSALNHVQEASLEAIGTEHILLAILENASESTKDVLLNAGMSFDSFKTSLSAIENRSHEYHNEHLFTPVAQKILNAAYETAKSLGASSLQSEHIVMSVIKEKSGIAYKIMKDSLIDTENLYEQILRPIEKEKPETLTIIKLAKEEARRLGHRTVGSELILLGIIVEGASIGSKVLSELGVNIKDTRQVVEKIIGFGDEYEGKEITLSQRAQKIIEFAWSEAKKAGKTTIGSEHLLFGIINEKGCVANRVLESLGVDAVEIKQGILREASSSEK